VGLSSRTVEAVRLVRYPLRDEGGWHLDLAALEAAIGPRTRAVIVVSPSNPTGAVHDAAELAALDRLCAANDLALLGDEVFADTALGPCPSVVAGRREALAFHLAGLSKICGLPQLKAAWIAAAGPEARVGPALARLEVVASDRAWTRRRSASRSSRTGSWFSPGSSTTSSGRATSSSPCCPRRKSSRRGSGA